MSWLKGNKKTSAGNFYSKAIAKMEGEPDAPFQDVWEWLDLVEERLQRIMQLDDSSDQTRE